MPVTGESVDLSSLEAKTNQLCEFGFIHELSWYLAYFKLNFRAEDTVPRELFHFSIEKLSPIVALKKTKLVFTNHTNSRSEIPKTDEALL